MPSYMAGVEGFEPPNGGIKTRDMGQRNQQVAEITDRRIPSSPLDSLSLPPKLPPAIGETAVVFGPAGRHGDLSSAVRKREVHCHITPVLPLRNQLHRPGRSEVVAESRTASQQELISRPS